MNQEASGYRMRFLEVRNRIRPSKDTSKISYLSSIMRLIRSCEYSITIGDESRSEMVKKDHRVTTFKLFLILPEKKKCY